MFPQSQGSAVRPLHGPQANGVRASSSWPQAEHFALNGSTLCRRAQSSQSAVTSLSIPWRYMTYSEVVARLRTLWGFYWQTSDPQVRNAIVDLTKELHRVYTEKKALEEQAVEKDRLLTAAIEKLRALEKQ